MCWQTGTRLCTGGNTGTVPDMPVPWTEAFGSVCSNSWLVCGQGWRRLQCWDAGSGLSVVAVPAPEGAVACASHRCWSAGRCRRGSATHEDVQVQPVRRQQPAAGPSRPDRGDLHAHQGRLPADAQDRVHLARAAAPVRHWLLGEAAAFAGRLEVLSGRGHADRLLYVMMRTPGLSAPGKRCSTCAWTSPSGSQLLLSTI